MMHDEEMEIVQDFLVEAFEMIEQLDQDLVELESRPNDLELLNRIFRVAHTVKGSSSFLNFDILTRLTHHMEDVLNKARHAEITITPAIMDVVLESIDIMKKLLETIRDSGNDASSGIDIEPTVARLDMISGGKDLADAPAVETPVISMPTESSNDIAQTSVSSEASVADDEPDYSNMSADEIEAEIERLLRVRQEEDKARRAAKGITPPSAPTPQAETTTPAVAPTPVAPMVTEPVVVNTPAPVAPKPVTPTPAPKPTPAKTETPPAKTGDESGVAVEQTIRVDVKRLDHLMNLIGELVLGKNRLLKIYGDVEERYEGEKFLYELNQVVSTISMVTTDLQTAVMKTRMLPIGKVFSKFPRMIRDLSRDLGKNINLLISGEETELDKSIVEEIGDPLVHIIRNSADHGIEDIQTRVDSGKPETGTVKLEAYNEGNSIIIQVSDDGKGMDPGILKMKAVEKGVISEKEADNMSDKDAFSLIFKPGFSTAAKVTNVSGRGVGMDVVKTNIDKLGGTIDIESEAGKGSVIKLKIPLTLAIIQALIVGVQEEFYAIPLASVLEAVRVTRDDIYTVEGKQVLRLRDEVLSLVRLADIFGVESLLESSEYIYVIVLGLSNIKMGLIVDTLVGQEEIVIKSLGDYLKGIDGIAGATIRGDGRVTLIVDVAALAKLAKNAIQKQPTRSESSLNNNVVATIKTTPADYKILIVDDSKTDRSIMKSALKPLGITTVEAANGVEALNLMKGNEEFDCVLIDIEMPKMDGYTLASEIRKYSRYKNLPLIAVTSRTGKSDRMRGVEVGMSEYITKPYSPDYLAGVVRRYIKL